ncbi:MAG: RHS repeat-associated core domain-containing protein, partial [Chthoniobacterales bacterium]
SGGIQEQYEYDAFGQPYIYGADGALVARNLGSPAGNRFLFTGREWLKELRVYDYRNRLYQPELGRFVQPDPKQFEAGDYNLYRYCHNDPVNRSDPLGMDPVFVSDEVAALAFQGDLRDLAQFNANTVLGIFRTYEYSTTVYHDSQGNLSLSETRTDQQPREVRPPENTKMTSLVETHNHIHDGDNDITHSKLSERDVARGNANGRTQEVITPGGTTDRYRPSDNANERKAGTGGIIERRGPDGKFHRLPGANTNLKNRLEARNGY